MARLFGIPIELLALGATLASGALVAALLAATLRRPVLARLALRNLPRRPGSALLVVAGLALGTAIVASALFTGDTMTLSVRALVADSLGRVDEVVLQTALSPGALNRRWVEAAAQGAPWTAGSHYFDASWAEQLAARLPPDSAVAALVPAIVEQATVADTTTQQLVPQATVLALPPDFPPVLGALAREDGAPLSLHLAPGMAYLNREAALQLEAQEGDALQLYLGERVLPLRLAAIFATGDLGGARPTVVLPLAALQAQLDRPGQINQILVVNRGERTRSVERSEAAARELRALLVDDALVARAQALLRRRPARQALDSVATTLRGPERERFDRLRAALDAPDPAYAGGALKEALGDPEIAARLGVLAARLLQGPERDELFSLLNAAGGLRVLELKRLAQERADHYASILTSIFVVLGLFSIATGLMLVFLVFALLASGRRTELAVARALGARQRDLVVLLLLEGLIYALGAAGLGVVAGLGITAALVTLLQRALEPWGLSVRLGVEPRSIAFALAAGLLLALVTIALAAWWTSRLNIAAALRDQVEPTGRAARWLPPALAAALAVPAAGLLGLGVSTQQLLPLALGLSAAVLAGERALQWALRRPIQRWPVLGRLLTAGASTLLLAGWWEPRRTVQALGLGQPPLTPEVFPVAGVAMALAAAWGLAANLGLLLALGTALARPLRALWLAGRLAAAYLGHQSGRAGLTMAMFALVLCSLTVASVLLAGAHRAYGRPEADDGGYALRAQASDGAEVVDLRVLLAGAPAVRPDDFPAIGGVRAQGGEIIRLGSAVAAWRPTSVNVLDAEFLHTTAARLSVRAPGYRTDGEVWRALAAQPGLAVVGAGLAATLELTPDQLERAPVWVRARDGGRAARVTVVGVLPPASPLGDGVFLGEPTAAEAELPSARQVVYYLRPREGLTPERAVSALNLSLGDRGLRASLVDAELRLSRAVQTPLSFLLRGFLGLGLISGVLAVGLLSARAVLERRAQLGMLRAVGMRAGAVQLSLLLEASTVALAGSATGAAVGTALGIQVVRYLQRLRPEFPLVVPVEQIVAIAALAWAAALVAASLPAWRAGRLSPVEALRQE